MAEITKPGNTPKPGHWWQFDWTCPHCACEWYEEDPKQITYDRPGYNESGSLSITMKCPWCHTRVDHPVIRERDAKNERSTKK